jgi:hypothetical protein
VWPQAFRPAVLARNPIAMLRMKPEQYRYNDFARSAVVTVRRFFDTIYRYNNELAIRTAVPA